MRWIAVWAACAAVGRARNIAIIGAGAAGSSAAYHLRHFAEHQNVPVNVTIFEKTAHVGGRSLTVDVFDDPSFPVELGGAIFVRVNHILWNASQRYDLPLSGMMAELESGDTTVIWDGEKSLFESAEGSPWWWEAGRMLWKYGMSPYRMEKMRQDVIGRFLKMYTPPVFPWKSLTETAHELGLVDATAITGEEMFKKNGVDERFAREIVQMLTRINYASNLAYIHGLETMVSCSTDGAVAVDGGNWRIFDGMVKDSSAAIYRNTSVASLRHADKSSSKYLLSTTSGSSAEDYPVAFDDVIIASPWQFSNIDAGDLIQPPEEIAYVKLHVTLFASPRRLRASYFNLDKPPSNVYTTLAGDEQPRKGPEGVGRTGFYALSTLRMAVNPKTLKQEYVYKIFSPAEVPIKFIEDVLEEGEGEAVSWHYPHWFYSYPMELPRVTFQDPVLRKGLYYTSGIESFISTMETSALMGMNVAKLIVDDIAGLTRPPPPPHVADEL